MLIPTLNVTLTIAVVAVLSSLLKTVLLTAMPHVWLSLATIASLDLTAHSVLALMCQQLSVLRLMVTALLLELVQIGVSRPRPTAW